MFACSPCPKSTQSLECPNLIHTNRTSSFGHHLFNWWPAICLPKPRQVRPRAFLGGRGQLLGFGQKRWTQVQREEGVGGKEEGCKHINTTVLISTRVQILTCHISIGRLSGIRRWEALRPSKRFRFNNDRANQIRVLRGGSHPQCHKPGVC